MSGLDQLMDYKIEVNILTGFSRTVADGRDRHKGGEKRKIGQRSPDQKSESLEGSRQETGRSDSDLDLKSYFDAKTVDKLTQFRLLKITQ